MRKCALQEVVHKALVFFLLLQCINLQVMFAPEPLLSSVTRKYTINSKKCLAM